VESTRTKTLAKEILWNLTILSRDAEATRQRSLEREKEFAAERETFKKKTGPQKKSRKEKKRKGDQLKALGAPKNPTGLSAKQINRPIMFGVLQAGGRLFVASSGIQPAPLFQMYLDSANLQAFVCEKVTHQIYSYVGSNISTLVSNCKVDNKPLDCAAGKLIAKAIQLKLPVPYHMTEVRFDIKNWDRVLDSSNKKASFSEHGISNPSCRTCEKLLPLMMCPEKIKNLRGSKSGAVRFTV
jgi:hypothetical protein